VNFKNKYEAGAKDNLERSTKNEKTRSYAIHLAEVFKHGPKNYEDTKPITDI
jgi:hypothetical protein